MGDRTMQPVQSPTPSSSATTSSQFTRMLSISAGPFAPSRPHRPHQPVPSSPEGLVIRNLKKRMNRLDLNARTPSSSSGSPTVASSSTGTGTGPHSSGAAATITSVTAAAATAALTTAIKLPTSKPSTRNNHDRSNNNNSNSNNNHDNNSSSGKKSSRRHKKDRNWMNGPPATLAPLLHPSSSLHHSPHCSQHHHRYHHGQERTAGGGKTRRREGSVGSGHGDGLIAGGGEGGSTAAEGPSGARKATGKGDSGVHGGGGEIVGCGGGTIIEATAAFVSAGNGGGGIGAGGGGREGRRRRKKEMESGGIGRKRTTIVNSYNTTTPKNINSSQPGSGWMPSGVGAEDSACGGGRDGTRGYQMRPIETGTGVGMGIEMGTTAGGGIGYSSSSVAGIQESGSSPGLQYQHHQQDHQSRHQYGYQQQNQQQYQRHQRHQMEQQMRQAADTHPGQQHAQPHQEQYQQGHQQQGPETPDKAIRSSFLQGIKTHALQPTQLTHLTLLRYEFLMNEFVEMMRLLPALQVLDLDVASVLSCSCRTFSRPYARHHHQQQHQASRHHHHSLKSLRKGSHNPSSYQQPLDPSFSEQPFQASTSSYTEAQYLWQPSQNDGSDEMDIDSGESNQASAVTLCSSCIRREGLFRHSQGTSASTAGPHDQFPTVRSLTFRGTAIVPELLALFPNLETLAFEEMRYKTPTPTIGPPSVPVDALIHGSAYSRAHSRMSSSQSQGEIGSGSFYTDSGDDSLDATASLSLEAGLPGPPSRQSVMISELAIMLKNHCPLLARLVLNEPLLAENLSREQLRLQNNSLSSSIGGQSPSWDSSQSHIYPANNRQQPIGASRVQDQLAQLLQVIPCLKQFVAHSWVVAKCPQLLDTLLEYHHPHLVSFQVLDDSQDMSHYPSILNPNATPVMPPQPQHHAFYSTQDIYDQQSPHQQQQLYEQQGYQYRPTFVPYGLESPAMQQQQQHHRQQQKQQRYDYPGGGGYDLPSSPSAQPSSLLHQALQMQYHLQQVQRQQIILRLQGSSFRILESCPNLQVFESKIPLPLQQLIGSVPRWACGSEITVLWLEIQELTGESGLDPEEEEVMQMFVRSLFKGSRSNTASSSPPQEITSSGNGEGGSSRLTTDSPSLPPPPPPTGAATAPGIVCDGSSPCASVGDMVSATATSPGFGSHLVEVGSSAELSSLGSVVPAGGGSGTFPSSSLPLDTWTSEGPHQQQPVLLSVPAVNIVSPAAGAGTPSGWNKPLLPPPPPLAFTSPATISLTMGGGSGGASYASGPCHIEGIERLVALQFLVEHQLVYLPKLDRFLMGNCVYTIPTRERVL